MRRLAIAVALLTGCGILGCALAVRILGQDRDLGYALGPHRR